MSKLRDFSLMRIEFFAIKKTDKMENEKIYEFFTQCIECIASKKAGKIEHKKI